MWNGIFAVAQPWLSYFVAVFNDDLDWFAGTVIGKGSKLFTWYTGMWNIHIHSCIIVPICSFFHIFWLLNCHRSWTYRKRRLVTTFAKSSVKRCLIRGKHHSTGHHTISQRTTNSDTHFVHYHWLMKRIPAQNLSNVASTATIWHCCIESK